MRWAILLAIGCGAAQSAGGEFHVRYPEAAGATGRVGQRFYAKPAASCLYDNGREAHWAITSASVASGELPAGITIEDGAITGKPTKPGAYAATIRVQGITCAGKPFPDEMIEVRITVKA